MSKKSWSLSRAVGEAALIAVLLACLVLPATEAAKAATGGIYGRVVDGTTGSGIPDVDVDVHEVGPEGDRFVTTEKTDANGDYRVSGLPAGSYKLFIDSRWHEGTKKYNCEWYADKFRKEKADVLRVSDGAWVRADAALFGLGSISGRVTSAQEPGGVADVYVYAYDPYYRLKGRCITDAQGNFRIDNLYAGKYKVRFDAQRAARTYADTWFGGGGFEEAALIPVAWEMDTGGVNGRLEAAQERDKRMKAVVMYGSGIGDEVEAWDMTFASFLESRDFRVERLYSEPEDWLDLRPEWDVLGDIFEGAKIIVYRGHGVYYGALPHCRVGGFCAMGVFFGYPELASVRFAERPVVLFWGACFTAGDHSAPVQTTDEEEKVFVARYANDFMGWERGDYFYEDSWRIDYTQRNLGFALYFAGYDSYDVLRKLCSSHDYRLDELIDEDYVEDPYRYNDESDPANPMKEDYRMLLPVPVGANALVGNMNLTTKDIIPYIPPPKPPAGYGHVLYFAEGCTRNGFQEYLTLGNPNASEARVQVAYLFADGDWEVGRYVVPAGSRTTIDVNAVVGPEKDVALRVASDLPLAAERPMYFNHGGFSGGHDAAGSPSPSRNWYFAEGYTGPGFEEWICVLNPGPERAELTVRFQTQEEGEIVRAGLVVQPYCRATFKVNDLLGGGDYQTSMSVESTQPVVVERPMYFDYLGTAGWHWSGGHCVMGATSLSRRYLFAEGTTRPGFEEWLTVQNPWEGPIEVRASYRLGEGQGDNVERSYVIPGKRRHTIYVPAEVGGGKDVSVELTCDSPFLAERPMYFDYASFGAWGWPGGDCVIGATEPATEWLLAEGYTGAHFQQWLCLQNPGREEAVVEITYLTQEEGPLPARAWKVPPARRVTIRVNDDAGPDYQLSTKVRVVSGPPIVVERPMYFFDFMWSGGHDVVGHAL